MTHEGMWRMIYPRQLMADEEKIAPVVEYDIPELLGNSAIALAIQTDGRVTVFNRGGDPIPAVSPETAPNGQRFIPGSGIRMVLAKTPPGQVGATIFGAEEGTTITVVGEVGVKMNPRCQVFIPPGQ